MFSLREQYQAQLRLAMFMARELGTTTELVMVYHRNRPTRISIIGSTISRVALEIWRGQGSRTRLLCHIHPPNKGLS